RCPGEPRSRRELELDQRRDDAEARAEIERERRRVEALLDETDLWRARPRDLDAALDEETSNALPLHAGGDGHRTDHRPGAPDVGPRQPDDLPIQLRDATAERVEREEMADVAPRIGRRRDGGGLPVPHGDVVERDEVDVSRAVGVALLERADRHRHGVITPLATRRAAPWAARRRSSPVPRRSVRSRPLA